MQWSSSFVQEMMAVGEHPGARVVQDCRHNRSVRFCVGRFVLFLNARTKCLAYFEETYFYDSL